MSSTDQDEGISTSNVEDAVDIPSSASQLDFRKDDKNPSKIPSESNISLEGTGDCVRPTKSDNDEPKRGSNNTFKEDATDITMGNLGAYGSVTKSGLEASTIQHSDKLDQTNTDKSDQSNTCKLDQTTTCKSDQPNTDKSDQTDSDKHIIINDDINPQMLTDKILECKTVTSSPTADTSSDIQDEELVLKWYDTESDEISLKSKTNDDTLSITSTKGDINNDSIETDEESIDKDLLKAIDTQISQLDEEITNSPDKTVSDEIIIEKLPLENTEKEKDSTNDQVLKEIDNEITAIDAEITSDMAKNVDKPIIDDNIATSSEVFNVLVPPSLTTTEIDKTSMESDVLESSDADIVLKCVDEDGKAEERGQESFKTLNDDIHVDPTKLDKNDDALLINTDVITESDAEISQLDEKLANSPHKTTIETFITTSSKEFDDKVPPSLEKTEIDKKSIKDHVLKAIDEEIATIDAELPSDTVKDVGTAIADENIGTSTKVLNEVLPTSPAKTESDNKLKESAIPKVKHPGTSRIDEKLPHSVAIDIEKTELDNSITKKDILKTIDTEILKLDSDLHSSPDKSMNKTTDEDIVTSDNKLLEEMEPPSVAQTELDKSAVKNDILEVTDAKSQLDEEHNSSGDKVQFTDEPIASTSKVFDALPKLEKDINPAKDIVEVIDSQISQLDEHTAIKANISDNAKIDESVVTEESMADTSDEVPEVTDSLGLLAESSRVIDQDDEEQETSDHDDGDDEEDFDPDDESSNQMTAEHSEDSNAQHSESDVPRDKPNLPTHVEALDDAQDFIDNTPEIESPMEDRDEFNFAITNVVSETAVGDIQEVSVDVEDDICNEIEDTLDTADDDNIEDVDITIEESTIEIEGTTIVAEDITIVAEDTTIEPKDTTIEAKDSASEAKVTTIDAKDSVVKAKDTTIEDKDTMIEAIDTAIKDKDTTVKAKDITIEIKDASLETKETAVAKTIPDTETDLIDDPPSESLSDADTVKLSDTSDTDETAGTYESHKLRKLLSKMSEVNEEKQSPSKQKKLEIAKPNNVVSIVDLEESSSEDDIQEVAKVPDEVSDDVTNVNISGQIEIMSSGGNTSDITTKKGEIVISGVPKPPPMKPARLNTSEVTIKTKRSEPVMVYPPAKIKNLETKDKLKHMSLEVFNLDSDEEGSVPDDKEKPKDKLPHNKCVNSQCTSDNSVAYYAANPSSVAYYDPGRKKRAMICAVCADKLAARAQRLIEGIRNLTPLLSLEMGSIRQELVEISDSDSDDDTDSRDGEKDTIGVEGASVVEEKLSRLLNETWLKYKLDDRLKEAHDELAADMERLEKESKEVDTMLTECQVATDKLRHELYTSFEREGQQMPPIVVFDTPDNVFTCTEADQLANLVTEAKASKRRLSSPSASETASKRAAIPLGYAPLDNETIQPKTTPAEEKDVKPLIPAQVPFISDAAKLDDDKDISVVNLSAEAAPADLPPPGDITRPPLRVGMQIYAMRNAFGSWLRGKVVECTPKGSGVASQFTLCRVRFENKTNKSAFKLLPARSLAYSEPAEVRMTIGTRLIALFKDTMQPARRESFYSGVVSEVPNPVNSYRYLVFFDDGYAQYVHHKDTRLVCEFSPLVWEEVHPFSRDFVREYLLAYPERPMVRLHTGQSLKTEWNGKWWLSRVVQVDASLVHVHFQEDNRTEWIYRGSTRLAPLYLELQAAERHRARPLPRNRIQNKVNMPYVEYTRSDELPPVKPATQPHTHTQAQAQAQIHAQSQQEEFRRQRSVAKKSTGASQPPPPAPAPHAPRPLPMPVGPVDSVQSRVVYYTPKNAVRPYKMVPHSCSPRCKRGDVLALNDLRTYNPLAKPLLSGWERQIVRVKSLKQVMYRAPCGRRLRNMRELHRYLRAVHSDMGVDLFDFGPTTNCLAEFVLNKCIIAKKDLSNGKENVPVPCVNYYDSSLPEFCSYNTERTPTEGVPLNLDPDFLCGCDCTDDCEDKSKCACWQMTLEGARTIGADSRRVGYVYKRLPEPLSSGIYECNSRCKCKSTCLNRVAQHPLQLKLQVFKTLNRGWGIRALNDVPKGAFLCVYAGNLLTDATANLDGLNEGDEYLAELDYIEVVEQMKEGYEEDIPNADKKLDQKQSGDDSSTEESSPSEDESTSSKSKKDDGDFEPGYTYRVTEFSKRLRKREKSKKEKEDGASGEKNKDSGKDKGEGDCITISDDEEVREPSRFMAQAGMGGNQFISKHKSVRSYFGEDEACYIMDAKVQGNIGRYLNHSCSPNVFVQNVFVDTHDPRFPWVAFFALWPIRAGTELTWNYNYDVGSVPGKVLYCYCGAVNCRGRLL